MNTNEKSTPEYFKAFLQRFNDAEPEMDRIEQLRTQLPSNDDFWDNHNTYLAQIGQMHVGIFHQEPVEFNKKGVAQLNEFLTALRDNRNVFFEDTVFLVCGAFLGEVIRKINGGSWFAVHILKTSCGDSLTICCLSLSETDLVTDPTLRVSRIVAEDDSGDLIKYLEGVEQLIQDGEVSDQTLLRYDEYWKRNIGPLYWHDLD